MAGDWIKVEENMPDKPEVFIIAAQLGIDPDAVAGKLIRVWAWATRNCNADGVTSVTVLPLLDRFSGVTGFADAMAKSGWLVVEGDSIKFPNFHRHISQTAKERANNNRRVAQHRSKCNGQSVTNVTVAPLQKPLPEKRREEKSNTKTVACADGFAPTAESIVSKMKAKPAYQGIDVQRQWWKMVAWCETNRKKPSEKRFVNWLNRCESTVETAAQPVRANIIYADECQQDDFIATLQSKLNSNTQ